MARGSVELDRMNGRTVQQATTRTCADRGFVDHLLCHVEHDEREGEIATQHQQNEGEKEANHCVECACTWVWFELTISPAWPAK